MKHSTGSLVILDVERGQPVDNTTTDGSQGDTAAVTELLAGAGLTMAAGEFERMVGVYPLLRAQADGLYSAEFADEDLALGFDPTIGFN